MGMLARLKAVFNRRKWVESSIQVRDGYGNLGAKPWPFNYHEAVNVGMRSWPYRCIVGNANMAASTQLRLYVRRRSRKELRSLGYRHGQMAFDSRPIGRRRLAHLTGQHQAKPSRIVTQKIMQFGDEFEEVMDHPLIDLLRGANSQHNGFDLAQFRFISKQITGNAYLHPIMSASLSRPVELWPLLPQWVWAVPGERQGEELIKGYVYGATRNEQKRFEVDEVLVFRTGINPKSLYYGYGPTEAAWLVLGTIYARQVMDKATYDNMARPDWMIVNEQMNQDQATRLKESIETQLKGIRNAGRMLAVGGKVTAIPMNWKPSELKTEDRHLEEVAGIYGYPITKILGNDPNRANAETGDAGWTKDTILPMLRQDEEALNQNGLLELFGDGELAENAVLAYDDPTPANRKMELAESKTLVLAGIRTINEDRAIRGDEDVEGGDVLRFNGRSLEAMDAEPALDGFGFGEQNVEPEKPAQPQVENIETTTDTVLNGAQVTAATAIVIAVAEGSIPRDAGIGQLEVLFNLSTQQAERIMGSAGTNTPTTPNPNPKEEAAREAQQAESTEGITDALRDNARSARRRADDPMLRGEVSSQSRRAIQGRGALSVGGYVPEVSCQLHDLRSASGQCDHHKCDSTISRFVDRAFAKADAADHEREGEPESVGIRMMRAIAKVLAEAEASIIAVINPTSKNLSETDMRAIEAAIRKINVDLQAEVRQYVERIIVEGGTIAIDTLIDRIEAMGLEVPSFTSGSPAVSQAARSFTERLAGEVTEATLSKMRESIAAGISEGDTPGDLARRVQESGAFSPARAEVIARSESARAYGKGALEGWKASGVVQGKVFQLAAGACPVCEGFAASVAGKVFDVDTPFAKVGTKFLGSDGESYEIAYADVDSGGTVHPQCRCWMEPVLIEPEESP